MVKSLMWLLDSVLSDISTRCGTATHRDKCYMSRRIEYEGLSFLTITLPEFSKDFERSLAEGQVDPDSFRPFRKRKEGVIPRFLGGILDQVFDPSGKLRKDASIDAIFCIRQLCLMFKKIGLPCSSTRTKETLDAYLACEYELADTMWRISERDLREFRIVSGILWSGPLTRLANASRAGDLRPRHGPGATAERVSGNSKYKFDHWHKRLEPHFPYDAYMPKGMEASFGNSAVLSSDESVEPGAERPVRVITVPKTLKGPRVIAIEPVCMQYTQQAVLEKLVELLESSPYSAGHVNFSDQGINRNHALLSSKDGYYATIDLSEASDRVHKDLAYVMLSSVPETRDMIFACRSSSAEMPDGTIVPLNKFASMGSALCFPVESMAFFTLCVLGRLRKANLPLRREHIERCARGVYVYGDDLIIPADEVSVIMDLLETFSLKVNRHKSFWTGKFRESCGMDAYDGVDVTPAYIRSLYPRNKRDTSAVLSWVSLANQLYSKGFWRTTQDIRDRLESLLRFEFPYVQEGASCLGWTSYLYNYSIQGWCNVLQAPVVRGPVVRVTEQDDHLSGYPALMKFFLKRGDNPIFGKHLERSVRPGSVNTKYRWVRPY